MLGVRYSRSWGIVLVIFAKQFSVRKRGGSVLVDDAFARVDVVCPCCTVECRWEDVDAWLARCMCCGVLWQVKVVLEDAGEDDAEEFL